MALLAEAKKESFLRGFLKLPGAINFARYAQFSSGTVDTE